jgi:hypothetical protein
MTDAMLVYRGSVAFSAVPEIWRIGFMERQARGREEEDLRLMIFDFGLWIMDLETMTL